MVHCFGFLVVFILPVLLLLAVCVDTFLSPSFSAEVPPLPSLLTRLAGAGGMAAGSSSPQIQAFFTRQAYSRLNIVSFFSKRLPFTSFILLLPRQANERGRVKGGAEAVVVVCWLLPVGHEDVS